MSTALLLLPRVWYLPALRPTRNGTLDDTDRHKLLGRYANPRFRYGQVVTCEVRGEIRIVGLTAAPIPWPIGQRPGGRARGLIIFKGLARAIRRENGVAVCHWWGVTNQTVSKWRKALGVGPVTPGTHRLKSERAQEPDIAAAMAKAQTKARNPERRRKIAEAKRGIPRPRHVIETMRKGRPGKPQSESAPAKMRAAAQRRAASVQGRGAIVS